MKRSRQTKKALTSSVLALVLCFVMLLGTTFAWFTDTASTGVSKIQAGELKIALEKKVSKDKETSWESIEDDEVLNFLVADEDGNLSEGEDILWEPGCTYQLPTLKVVNKGDLALEYMVVVTAVVGDVNLAEVLDVYYTETGTSYDNTKVGTLNDILTSEDEDGFAHGTLLAEQDSGEITIALHMQESAGNQYQDKSITGIKVAVYAKQDTYEYDSNGNDYDAQAEYDMGFPVKSVEELERALENGQEAISVMTDLALGAPITISGEVTLYGPGTISPADGYTGTLFNVPSGAKLTLQNIEVNGSNEWTWLDGQKNSTSMPSTGDKYDITKAVSSNGTELTASLITSAGNLVLGSGCEIRDTYYIGEWGSNPIVRCTGGTLTLDGAVIENNLGTIFSVDSTEVTINSCTIKNNFAYNANKGGIFALFNSTCTMNGGTIRDNAGHVRSGFIFGVINGSKLTINDGTITNNLVKNRGSSTGSVVCCENGGDFDMNGGSITNNRGILAGALSARWVFNGGDTSNTIINLNGGTISGNTCIQNLWHNAEVFVRDTVTTIGTNMTVTGNVVLDTGTTVVTNNGTIDGNVFVQSANATMTNNGTVTGDVTVTAGTFAGNGTVNGTVTKP